MSRENWDTPGFPAKQTIKAGGVQYEAVPGMGRSTFFLNTTRWKLADLGVEWTGPLRPLWERALESRRIHLTEP